MSKHLFLALYFLTFSLNALLAGILFYLYRTREKTIYNNLAGGFGCFGLFMLCWYLSSYWVLNIQHRETLFYSSLEALAFIGLGTAVYFWWRTLLQLAGQPEPSKFLYLTFAATGLLVLTKYSYYLCGANYPVFYWIKITVIIGLAGTTIFLSALSIHPGVTGSGFSGLPPKLIAMAGIFLPIAGSIDYFLIKDKFYEGPVRLSMNFPLFISGFLAFTLGMTILLIRHILMPEYSRTGLDSLAGQYPVTPREMEIIGLVLEGKSNQEIAGQLFISPATVKNHLHHIFEKLGISSRYELISRVKSK